MRSQETKKHPHDGATAPGSSRVSSPDEAKHAAPSRHGATPSALLRLQATAGNAAVARLVAQRATRTRHGGVRTVAAAPIGVAATPLASGVVVARSGQGEVPVEGEAVADDRVVQRKAGGGGDCPAPPVAPEAPDPKADPKFKAVTGDVKGKAKDLKKHPAASAEVKKAQDAAQPPGDDRAGQAKAAQADKMAAAKPKGFDKAGFIAAVKRAIADAAPKNLDEADKLASSGKADSVKSQVMSKVSQGKDDSGKDVAEKTKEAPDPSVAKEKLVTPLKEEPVVKPAAPKGAKAMPDKAPAEQVDLRAGPCDVDTKMKDAEVTEEHLEKSNEPEMQEAGKAKKEGEAHAAAAPEQIRKTEGQALKSAEAGADEEAKAKVQGMFDTKGKATGKSGQQKSQAKSKEEADRARVAGEINKIYDKTKIDVEQILGELDGKVATEFEKGEAEAKSAFTNKHKTDMERYKDDRYSGAFGWARWTSDLFAGLPAEADRIFERARLLYESKMEVVISKVADLVGSELTRAKDRIEIGRQQIKDYIAKQPKDLQKIANEAGKEIGGRFDELESDVDAKQDALVSDLAQKYVEARNKVDEEIKAEQEKNKGLVAKAIDAVGGAIQAILKLKDLFLSMLAKAASVFTKILSDPIGFIGNFMSAVKQGFMNFATNILDHLKKGLMGWLFGALASAGIEIPDSFDLKGILKLILSILGLTWANIRARIVKLIPAPVMDFLESKVEVFVILAKEGAGGLWRWISEKVGDLVGMVLGPIKTFVIEKIVKAGITWVLGMLNPAGALIKIIQALISVVQWIVERGAQLVEFVGTVIDGVVDIARGGVGGVPAKIEGALSKAVPLVISFLASLLGLGGISEKIREVLETVQKPVSKAIDGIVKGALKGAKGLIDRFRKKKSSAKDATAGDVKARVSAELANRLHGPVKSPDELRNILGEVAAKYRSAGLKSLSVSKTPDSGGMLAIRAEASPATDAARFKAAIGLDVGDVNFTSTGERKVSLTGNLEKHRPLEVESLPFGKIDSEPKAVGGRHAEAILMDRLRSNWDSMCSPEGANIVHINLTASPCPACAPKLESFLSEMQRKKGRKNRGTAYGPEYSVALDIKFASVYKAGAGIVAEEESKAGLESLYRTKGISLAVWDLIAELRAKGVDPELAIGDPAVYKKLEAKISKAKEILDSFSEVKVT